MQGGGGSHLEGLRDRFGDLDSLPERLSEAQLVGANRRRRVHRWVDHQGMEWFVKEFQGARARELAQTEADLHRGLLHRGLPVAPVVGLRHQSDRSFLVLGGLPGQELDEWARAQPPSARRAVWRRLGESLARWHHQGATHGQLFAWHVLVDGDRLGFLDVATARLARPGTRPSARACWRDLAGLLATLDRASCGAAERRRLLAAYGWSRQQCKERWRSLRKEEVRWHRRGRLPRQPPLQDWREGADKVCLVEEVATAIGDPVVDLDAWLRPPGAEVIRERDGRANLRWRGAPGAGPRTWFGKAFPAEPWRARTAAVREWFAMDGMRALGFHVPRVVAYARRRRGVSVLWTEGVEPGTTLRDWLHRRDLARGEDPAAWDALRWVTRQVRRLHAAGYCHRDLYLDHFLLDAGPGGPRWCWIDWTRLEEHPVLPAGRRVKDLARLEYSARTAEVPWRWRLRAWREYWRGGRPEGRSLLRRILAVADRIQRHESRHGCYPVARP